MAYVAFCQLAENGVRHRSQPHVILIDDADDLFSHPGTTRLPNHFHHLVSHNLKRGSGGTLDYVSAWLVKAGAYATGGTRIGFVATNSTTQGEQVGQLWPLLFDRCGLEIAFAHRTFAWGLGRARQGARARRHPRFGAAGQRTQREAAVFVPRPQRRPGGGRATRRCRRICSTPAGCPTRA